MISLKEINKYVLFFILIPITLFYTVNNQIFPEQEIIYHDSYNGYLGNKMTIDINNLQIKAMIRTNEGIEIKSYTDTWNKQKLQLLYEELLKNRHGEELIYLKEINIYPSMPETLQEMGHYQGYWSWNNKGDRWYDKGIISLYNGDMITTVEEYSRILSHEYGHHFTMYYLWVKEGKTFKADGNWKNSGYYKVRKFKEYPLVVSDYKNGHYWAVHEIAAEDYVQLYGSPTIYQFETYYDVYDRFYYKLENPEPKIQHYNFYPQENSHIPLAHDIPEIKEYWSSLAGFDCGEKINTISSISLEWVNYITYEGDKAKRLDEFYVNIPNNVDDEWLYTLIAFNNEGKKYPIRTFTSNDSPYCYFGYVQETVSGEVYKEEDSEEFRKGIIYFVVNAVNKRGIAISSNKIVLDFDEEYIYTIKEDYDFNGIVDYRDIDILLPHYGEINSEFDNNGDNVVDIFDLINTSKLIK
ncbi:hypothetical protein Y919_08900 [Caloranaerobacter azorensis H53214]|uniref:Dockerin domain-containing protein n=1 Tax=Caloranaerobacter azorensis H53214 TaxID=1156417 RepID=A0A096BFJ1_9FIRM|nr:hypothetical protein [Caloranaerobacter azorensis]KGG79955.1 hypothetical protein Y919_08900 [Caloranaerobacter azorensis H53214]